MNAIKDNDLICSIKLANHFHKKLLSKAILYFFILFDIICIDLVFHRIF